MSATGHEPWILGIGNTNELSFCCQGFVASTRLRRHLWLPFVPDTTEYPNFWDGLALFCTRQRISDLRIERSPSIPLLLGEVERQNTADYELELDAPDWQAKVAPKHMANVRNALSHGITVHRTTDPNACVAHVRLVNESLERRRMRGEKIHFVNTRLSNSTKLLSEGAGELFQAVGGDTIVSSAIILKSPQGAFYESAGTSATGRVSGASHLLLFSAAQSLRFEGIRRFNLADGDAPSPGLKQFKRRFGAAAVPTVSVTCYLGSRIKKMVSESLATFNSRIKGGV
jgi:hypothetical protein